MKHVKREARKQTRRITALDISEEEPLIDSNLASNDESCINNPPTEWLE